MSLDDLATAMDRTTRKLRGEPDLLKFTIGSRTGDRGRLLVNADHFVAIADPNEESKKAGWGALVYTVNDEDPFFVTETVDEFLDGQCVWDPSSE